MYKLLLADGTQFTISTYGIGSAKRKGTYVKSVNYGIVDSDLDTIKNTFNNNEKTSIMKVYDENMTMVLAEYEGYSNLNSISIDPDINTSTSTISIVMCLGDNISDLIDAWTKKLDEMKETQRTTKQSIDTLATSNENLAREMSNKVSIANTDITKMTLDEAKEYKIQQTKVILADYLASHPITSSCHGGVPEQYSITSEKQQYLSSMIMLATMADQSGISFQPSWNASGKECTYDWTLQELQQLAIEIESTVRPLVSKQQEYEASISACKTIDEIKAINIKY